MNQDQNATLEPHEKAIAAIGAVIAHLEAEGRRAVSGAIPCPVCTMGQLSWLQIEGNSTYYQCSNFAICVSGHIAK